MNRSVLKYDIQNSWHKFSVAQLKIIIIKSVEVGEILFFICIALHSFFTLSSNIFFPASLSFSRFLDCISYLSELFSPLTSLN